MIFYLTYNDGPSGIYSSQVIDVVKFIRNELDSPIRLVSFISFRKFLKNRAKIKIECPEAIVLPMVPGIKRWRWNRCLLKFLKVLHQPEVIIGRSVLATQLAMRSKKTNQRVVYDGRGAIAAEWKEYKVVNEPKLLSEIEKLEHSAIHDSDFRIAVSGQLVEYWKMTYGYRGSEHIVIPCTLNAIFEHMEINDQRITGQRKAIGLKEEDTVFVYSGSLAGWQSFDLLYGFVSPLLISNSNFKLLFLSERDLHISKLELEFPAQIVCRKVQPEEVPAYLFCGDYGLLIRDESTTNKVASPVKFAEYLASGLKVVISEQLGDYTDFVKTHKCGYTYTEAFPLVKLSLQEKMQTRNLALKFFTKNAYRNTYSALTGLVRSNNSIKYVKE